MPQHERLGMIQVTSISEKRMEALSFLAPQRSVAARRFVGGAASSKPSGLWASGWAHAYGQRVVLLGKGGRRKGGRGAAAAAQHHELPPCARLSARDALRLRQLGPAPLLVRGVQLVALLQVVDPLTQLHHAPLPSADTCSSRSELRPCLAAGLEQPSIGDGGVAGLLLLLLLLQVLLLLLPAPLVLLAVEEEEATAGWTTEG